MICERYKLVSDITLTQDWVPIGNDQNRSRVLSTEMEKPFTGLDFRTLQ